MNRLIGQFRWLLRSRNTRRLEEKALAIADRYGMRKEYLAARKFGLDPLSALDDWDLIRPEERALLEKEELQGKTAFLPKRKFNIKEN